LYLTLKLNLDQLLRKILLQTKPWAYTGQAHCHIVSSISISHVCQIYVLRNFKILIMTVRAVNAWIGVLDWWSFVWINPLRMALRCRNM
jgi:hypothetical protein